jgi:hypothetical protein
LAWVSRNTNHIVSQQVICKSVVDVDVHSSDEIDREVAEDEEGSPLIVKDSVVGPRYHHEGGHQEKDIEDERDHKSAHVHDPQWFLYGARAKVEQARGEGDLFVVLGCLDQAQGEVGEEEQEGIEEDDEEDDYIRGEGDGR